MFYPSLEVRWFGAGAIPAQLETWFHALGPLLKEETVRIDHYYREVEQDSLGIKQRSGKLEVKWRHQTDGIVRFTDNISGVLEYWRKLSSIVAEDEEDVSAHLRKDIAWVGVEKRRTTRKYEFTHSQHITAVDPETPVDQGCNLERTMLMVDKQLWWTLGFEAFGEEDKLQQNLRLVTEHVFRKERPLSLPAADSYGYPAWLSRLRF